ncbi:unnamed protein product [Brassica rapa]|uniref:Uncharacterized protein n=2 Tax=Brassica TaxID=3705 RepID=A0A8D9HNK1_BRACM|nr:unnamed protein product [Brassica napus]CAG7900936.1 unnamed protein product [Brassica rapa]
MINRREMLLHCICCVESPSRVRKTKCFLSLSFLFILW